MRVPYRDKKMKTKIVFINTLISYPYIFTVYPDYDIDESVYEIKISPFDSKAIE